MRLTSLEIVEYQPPKFLSQKKWNGKRGLGYRQIPWTKVMSNIH